MTTGPHAIITPLKAIRMLLDGSGVLVRAERWEEIEAMARCFCECHSFPGVYPPPCGVCGHDTREGHMVGGYRDGWEPNESPCPLSLEFRDGVTCGPYRTAEGCHNHQVIAGLRERAVTADRLEIELRSRKIALDLRTEERDRLILAVKTLGDFEHFAQCPVCLADRTNGEWHADDCPAVREG